MSAEQWGGGLLIGGSVLCALRLHWWLWSELRKTRRRVVQLEGEKLQLEGQLQKAQELNAWLRGRVVRRRL